MGIHLKNNYPIDIAEDLKEYLKDPNIITKVKGKEVIKKKSLKTYCIDRKIQDYDAFRKYANRLGIRVSGKETVTLAERGLVTIHVNIPITVRNKLRKICASKRTTQVDTINLLLQKLINGEISI